MIDSTTRQVIKRCQGSPSFFLSSFAKIQHPKLGITPFNLFSYQKKCLAEFLKNRFTIFRKVRQAGVSTIAGGFALWYGMFFNQKRILIVSKRDLDAMDFLRKNVKIIHDNLPQWMRDLWPRIIDNEHEIGFPNGSRIMSLTSSKDTLRSYASSLNIIDEAAFIDFMQEMWASGASTMSHGGSCIVISTVNGIGNWYWQTWTDADADVNDFKPIQINWWDMDWKLEFVDELSGKPTVIAPTFRMRRCETAEEIEKYGPYWSPWLEEQYRQLTQRGDSRKFRQEILAEFLGSGHTVLGRPALITVQSTIDNNYKTVKQVDYVNPHTEERAVLDFDNRLWVWKTPVKGKLADPEQGLPAQPAHIYIVAADTSSGDANDFSAIEVFDITTQEQVAELQIKTLPRVFAMMVDYISRWYNNALCVVERTGIGVAICNELADTLMCQSLYRRPKKNAYNKDSKYGDVGFNTSVATKPLLNKLLIDNIGEDGWLIKSSRLYKELLIYVHLKGNRTGAEPGRGNTDDLVMATALSFIGIEQAATVDITLIPVRSDDGPKLLDQSDQKYQEMMEEINKNILMPVSLVDDTPSSTTIEQELKKFMGQLGGLHTNYKGQIGSVNPKKHIINVKRWKK